MYFNAFVHYVKEFNAFIHYVTEREREYFDIGCTLQGDFSLQKELKRPGPHQNK